MRQAGASSAIAAGLFASTLFWFGPVAQALGNRDEVLLGWLQVAMPLALIAIAVWLIGLALLHVLPVGVSQRVAALMGVLGLLWWAQGTLLAPLGPDYGVLDGHPIEWDGLRPRAILAFVLFWVAPGAFALCFPARALSQGARMVYGACMAVQALGLVVQALAGAPSTPRVHQVETADEVAFSSTRNIIVLVVDAFQSDVWHEVIDRQPELTRAFDGFTYFRNALAGWGNTNPSIQSILTAELFDNSVPLTEFTSRVYRERSSLPLRLKQAGYVVELYTPEPNVVPLDPLIRDNLIAQDASPAEILHTVAWLIDVSAFRHAPDLWKGWVMNSYRWRFSAWARGMTAGEPLAAVVAPSLTPKAVEELRDVGFLNRVLTRGRADREAPRFAFHHLEGIHLPIKMDGELRALNVALTPTREHYLTYARGSVRLLGLFLDRLRELGVYDGSLIVIAADHGTGRLPLYAAADLNADRLAGPGRPPAYAWQGGRPLPLLLVKPFAADGALRTSDAPVSLTDIPKTVLALAGEDTTHVPGQAMFDIDDMHRPRLYGHFWGDDKSRLRRFSVSGFAWYADSWGAPEIFEAPARANFVSEAKAKQFVERPRFYGLPEHQAPRLRLAELNGITFARPEGKEGDAVGIGFALVGLDPGVGYTLDLELLDACVSGREGFLEQSLEVAGARLDRFDPCRDDAFAGWRESRVDFIADASEVVVAAEVRLTSDPAEAGRFSAWLETGSPRDGVGWHRAAAIGVRNLALRVTQP